MGAVNPGLFDELTSSEALFAAWDVFCRGKRLRADVQKFWRRLEGNIFAIRRELIAGTYQHGAYDSFFIHDPKHRHIRKAGVRDRIVHQVVHTWLVRICEPCLIHDLYSGRDGKGTHAGVNALERMTYKVSRNYSRPCWALKCDIRKFYDSVCHSILMRLVAKRIRDTSVLKLVREIVESFHTEGVSGTGLPIGNVTSQIFTNIYLNELDQFVKHRLRVEHYVRFSDDFVLLSERRADLVQWLQEIEIFLEQELKLALHQGKVSIRPLHQGIDFLGYVLLPYHRVMRSSTRRRMIRRLSGMQEEELLDGRAPAALRQSMSSYLGMLSHANTVRLQCLVRNRFSSARDRDCGVVSLSDR